jgi:GT2 family glycosyltransferase
MPELALSVVIPTCGRPDLLDRCIGALAQQSLDPARFEVIVVDDRPNPQTEAIVVRWRRALAGGGPGLRYLANHGRHGPAAARNLGWRAARAANLAFTDDDTVPTSQWLEHGLAAFAPGVAAVCGRLVMPLPDAPTDYERDAVRLEEAEFVTANCFCRKSVMERLGGFDERFRMAWREDSDLHFSLLTLGFMVGHAPQALVVHPVRSASWGVSLGQQRKIQFDALLYKKHPLLYRKKIRARPRWDYYGLVAMLLAALLGIAAGARPIALAGAVGWAGMTAMLCRRRLTGTTRRASHVAEMIVTSVLIPPYAVFWRAVGALRFGAWLT